MKRKPLLTLHYRYLTRLEKVAMVEQGLGFAAARLQALARSARVRKLMASIWRQADEFAKKVMQYEREAMMREEDTLRVKQKVSLCSVDEQRSSVYDRVEVVVSPGAVSPKTKSQPAHLTKAMWCSRTTKRSVSPPTTRLA